MITPVRFSVFLFLLMCDPVICTFIHLHHFFIQEFFGFLGSVIFSPCNKYLIQQNMLESMEPINVKLRRFNRSTLMFQTAQNQMLVLLGGKMLLKTRFLL